MYDDQGWNAQLLVCNYGSAGNMPTAKMYEVGRPGSKCPAGTSRNDPKYKGLCGKEQILLNVLINKR